MVSRHIVDNLANSARLAGGVAARSLSLPSSRRRLRGREIARFHEALRGSPPQTSRSTSTWCDDCLCIGRCDSTIALMRVYRSVPLCHVILIAIHSLQLPITRVAVETPSCARARVPLPRVPQLNLGPCGWHIGLTMRAAVIKKARLSEREGGRTAHRLLLKLLLPVPESATVACFGPRGRGFVGAGSALSPPTRNIRMLFCGWTSRISLGRAVARRFWPRVQPTIGRRIIENCCCSGRRVRDATVSARMDGRSGTACVLSDDDGCRGCNCIPQSNRTEHSNLIYLIEAAPRKSRISCSPCRATVPRRHSLCHMSTDVTTSSSC
jgi:hypothetical protein